MEEYPISLCRVEPGSGDSTSLSECSESGIMDLADLKLSAELLILYTDFLVLLDLTLSFGAVEELADEDFVGVAEKLSPVE